MDTTGTALVSVIIPTYNSAKFIVESVSGVLAQTFGNYELIVVDDGSCDETREVLATCGGAITYLQQEHQGPSAARNAGIRKARGEFICFLDADDRWMPNKLELQTAFMTAHPSIGLLFADAEEAGEQAVQKPSILASMTFGADALRERPLKDAFRKLLLENFIPTSTVMIRKSCLCAVGLFDETLQNAEDRDMWLRLSAVSEVACLPQVLARKRLHGGNISSRTEVALRARIKVWNKARCEWPALAPSTVYQKMLASTYQELGYIALMRSEGPAARKCGFASLLNAGRYSHRNTVRLAAPLVVVDRVGAVVVRSMAPRALTVERTKLRSRKDCPPIAWVGARRMKSVVMIAYYFPPDGGAAAFRPLRFVRHMAELGWQPTVVTRTGDSPDRYDPGLLNSVPPETEIVRVAGKDLWQTVQAHRTRRFEERVAAGAPRAELQAAHQRPARSFLRGLVHQAEAWFYYPDRARPWSRPAARVTVGICQQRRPDVLLGTGGPWSSFLVAHQAFERTGVPYVLDFRDSWTLTRNEDFEMLRPGWAQRNDRRLLGKLFTDARAVVFRYQAEAECYWNAYRGALDQAKIHIIPNGYEGPVDQFEAAPDDRCTILYTGTVVSYQYDAFLEALSFLREAFPIDASRLRVLFVGEGVDAVGRAAAARELTDIVETRAPVSSNDAARLQHQADALLLLGPNPYQGHELVGSKVFGYLKAGRPILGILAADESRKVLEGVGVTTLADVDSPDEIADLLRYVIAAWSAKCLPLLLPDPEKCAVYEATHQTRALVRALEGGPALTPFRPGSVEMPDSLKEMIGHRGWLSTRQ